MGKQVIFGTDVQNKLLSGINLLADAVKVTLGAAGRNVALERLHGAAVVTKDGVTVARDIQSDDKLENIGVQMIKQVASKMGEDAGDGTTTATVLTQAIYKAGLKSVDVGFNLLEIKRGMDKAIDLVVADIDKLSREVKSEQDVIDIATISVNSDIELGKLIAKAINTVGEHGLVTTEGGNGTENVLKVSDGLSIKNGYLSSYFVTDKRRGICELKNPYILVTDKKISNPMDLRILLEKSAVDDRPLLIVADDIEGEALGMLVVNSARKTIKVCAVRAPSFGDNKANILNDVALVTGAKVLCGDKGDNFSGEILNRLGSCDMVKVDKSTCSFIKGHGDKEQVKALIEDLTVQLKEEEDSFYIKQLEERRSKLSKGVATILVGGSSEAEIREKTDRVDDSLNATKAALEDGIVAGGGLTLLQVQNSLDLKSFKGDELVGAKIIKDSLSAPLSIICKNGGEEPLVIIDKIRNRKYKQGYDIKNRKFVDMFEAGILDPAKVTKASIKYAGSIAGMLLTTEAIVCSSDKDTEKLMDKPTF